MNDVSSLRNRTLRIASPVLVAAAVATIVWVSAGDLDPPPGAIQPTNRVQLNQQTMTWPYTISAPGSYVLTSDLEAPGGHTGHGITIEADDVTLDLNGFALIGVAGSLNGVEMSAGLENVAVFNGTIRSWGGMGVSTAVDVFNGANMLFEDLRISENGGHGLLAPVGSTVVNCLADSNGGNGIIGGGNSVISGCVADGNALHGMEAGIGCTIRDSTLRGNGGFGIFASQGCTIVNCVARDNIQSGFGVSGTTGAIVHCMAYSNGGSGIESSKGVILGCTAVGNQASGIVTGEATVRDCTVGSNGEDGIRVVAEALVVGNLAEGNGTSGTGAGIHVPNFGSNRIEANFVVGNPIGIHIEGTRNLIVKNSASDNSTDYDIASGNSYGPIVNVGGIGDISSVPKADHPWANFSLTCDAGPEVCDGVDNDCDTLVDEDFPTLGQACSVGTGQCEAFGTIVCKIDQTGTECDATPGTPTTEVCDGVDNDCDGATDEGNPGGGGACNTGLSGVCAAGTAQCLGGAIQCVQNTQASPEVCDGLDNDCDGATDEGNPGGGGACNTGLAGVCAAGTAQCLGGAIQCVQDTQASPEVCDGLDNDCDGATDEGNPGGGGACNTGLAGVCAAGTAQCLGGAIQCVQDTQASPEVCDGLDNDCDGATDEGNPGGGGACNTGLLGVCAAGTQQCLGGAIQCVQDTQASPEVCDGLDNDCDGATDEGCN